MSHNGQKAKADRRGFLKLLGVGALSGGAALALDNTSAEASEKDAASKGSYRETEHVKTYYESTRF